MHGGSVGFVGREKSTGRIRRYDNQHSRYPDGQFVSGFFRLVGRFASSKRFDAGIVGFTADFFGIVI